jgi:arginase
MNGPENFSSTNPTAALFGIPLDANSSFLRGAALAPPLIRKALHSHSSNLCAESGLDLAANSRWADLGDLPLGDGPEAIGQIEREISALLESGYRVLSLGGDHSISFPLITAVAKKYAGLNILHFDAHPDLYHDFEGNKYSHASPFARIMEEGRVRQLVQVGIRTSNPHQHGQAERFNVRTIEMRDWRPGLSLDFEGPLYISLDLDALDPAFAPGVSHLEPGGLSVRDVLGIIQNVSGTVVGGDIVEYNPARDINGLTAMVAAKFSKELLARIIGDATLNP